jgi:hypothetical protein
LSRKPGGDGMSKRIELQAITKLSDRLLRSDHLIPDIKTNDTTPSWDGFIELYKNRDLYKRKKDLLSRIPVQVKGHLDNNISRDTIPYNIKKADLSNYLNDGGVIFIIVVMQNYDNYRIYYETLTPLKLKRYIKAMGNKDSASIMLNTLPIDNVEELTDIFFNFSYDMKKPASDNFLSLNEFMEKHPKGFDSFSMVYQGLQYKNPIDYSLSHEVTIYANHSVAGISIPVDIMQLANFSQYINQAILIENVEYYSGFKLVHKKNGAEMIIGESISIMFSNEGKETNFNYKIHGSLSQRIIDTKFILALLKYKHFNVGGETPHTFFSDSSWGSFDFDENIQYYEKYYEYLLNIKKLLSILRIKEDLNFLSMTDEYERNVNFLISAILYNNPQELTFTKRIEENSFRKTIKIDNLTVLLLFIRQNDEKYKIINFFSDELSASFQSKTDNARYFKASIYLSLTKEDFLTVSNIDYDIIYNSFLKLENDDELLKITTNLLLVMLSAYDDSVKKSEGLLDTTLRIAEWIIEKNTNKNQYEYFILNRLQIIRRMRIFTENETTQICDLIKNIKKNDIRTAAYILIGDKKMAMYYFSKMSKKRQNEFKQFPIMTLLSNGINE